MPPRAAFIGDLACASGYVAPACASTTPEQRATKPQVTISGATVDRVKSALTAEMARRKFRAGKEKQLEMSFEQPAPASVLQSLSSAEAAGHPIERVTYTIAPEGADLRIVADVAIVRKLAAMEKEIDINQTPEGQSVQGILDKVAGEVGSARASKQEK
jgi:hypothetical protein